jgi:chromosome segregation ATPase
MAAASSASTESRGPQFSGTMLAGDLHVMMDVGLADELGMSVEDLKGSIGKVATLHRKTEQLETTSSSTKILATSTAERLTEVQKEMELKNSQLKEEAEKKLREEIDKKNVQLAEMKRELEDKTTQLKKDAERAEEKLKEEIEKKNSQLEELKEEMNKKTSSLKTEAEALNKRLKEEVADHKNSTSSNLDNISTSTAELLGVVLAGMKSEMNDNFSRLKEDMEKHKVDFEKEIETFSRLKEDMEKQKVDFEKEVENRNEQLEETKEEMAQYKEGLDSLKSRFDDQGKDEAEELENEEEPGIALEDQLRIIEQSAKAIDLLTNHLFSTVWQTCSKNTFGNEIKLMQASSWTCCTNAP